MKTLFADNLEAKNYIFHGKKYHFLLSAITMGNLALRLFDVLNTYSIMNRKIHQIEKGQIEINIV